MDFKTDSVNLSMSTPTTTTTTWSDLLQEARRNNNITTTTTTTTTNVDSAISSTLSTSQQIKREFWLETVPLHLTSVANQLQQYENALYYYYRRRRHRRKHHHHHHPPIRYVSETSNPTTVIHHQDHHREQRSAVSKKKQLILQTRLALRFGLICMSVADDSIRTVLQRVAILNVAWHVPLASILSYKKSHDNNNNDNNDDDDDDDENDTPPVTTTIGSRSTAASGGNGDAKCRLLASKLLCNLVTANGETAYQVIHDIPLSLPQLLSFVNDMSRRHRQLYQSCDVARSSRPSSSSSSLLSASSVAARSSSNNNHNINNYSDEHVHGREEEEEEEEEEHHERDETEKVNDDDYKPNWVDMILASSSSSFQQQGRETMGAIVAALHNCTVSLHQLVLTEQQEQQQQQEEERTTTTTTTTTIENWARQVSSNPLLVSTLLRQVLPATAIVSMADPNGHATFPQSHLSKGNVEHYDDDNHDDDDKEDGATEWIFRFLILLCRLGQLDNLYTSAKGGDGGGVATTATKDLTSTKTNNITPGDDHDNDDDDYYYSDHKENNMSSLFTTTAATTCCAFDGSKMMVVPEQVVLLYCLEKAMDDYTSAQQHHHHHHHHLQLNLPSQPSTISRLEQHQQHHPLGGLGGMDVVISSHHFLVGLLRAFHNALPSTWTIMTTNNTTTTTANTTTTTTTTTSTSSTLALDQDPSDYHLLRAALISLIQILTDSLGMEHTDMTPRLRQELAIVPLHLSVSSKSGPQKMSLLLVPALCRDLALLYDTVAARHDRYRDQREARRHHQLQEQKQQSKSQQQQQQQQYHPAAAGTKLDLTADEQLILTLLVRCLGNFCFQCPANQDLMRLTLVPRQMDVADAPVRTAFGADHGPPISTEPTITTTTTPTATTSTTTAATTTTITTTTMPTPDGSDGRTALHVVMSCTSLGPACFTLREWAVIALRSMLQDNEGNQRLAAQLEAQQPVQTAELDQMGIRVDMDSQGNVSVVPLSNDDDTTHDDQDANKNVDDSKNNNKNNQV